MYVSLNAPSMTAMKIGGYKTALGTRVQMAVIICGVTSSLFPLDAPIRSHTIHTKLVSGLL